jgi:primosomal protein N' (replication factor Y)
MEVTEEASYPEARDIREVIESRPLLSPAHAALTRWLSDHYLAPLFECVSLMLPPGFKRKPVAMLRPLVSAGDLPRLDITEKQRATLAHIIERVEVDVEELRRTHGLANVTSLVNALLRRDLIQRTYRFARPQVRPKVVGHLRLLVSPENATTEAAVLRRDGSARARRRAIVLQALADEGAVPLGRLRGRGLTPALLRDLEAEGVAAREEITVIRDPLAGRAYERCDPATLTADQRAVSRRIEAALDAAAPGRSAGMFLLHGVTGSGKTEVYLAALDRARALGKRAIVLVPEISLTPQTVRRFGERFPDQVAVMHSQLSLGEHFDMWHEVRDGRYRVVVGPRGALFAPQPELGLIIMDEEHEWTYKQQEGAPRYHARRAAEELCRHTGAVLVLGSATPDVESRFRAEGGAYRLLELPQRLQRTQSGSVKPAPLPQVEVVDLASELKSGNRSIFSRSLARGIRAALDAKEQVILFLNRRGTASFVQCRDCGHVPSCRSCEVALTYHASESALVCHYCRRRRPAPQRCPQCGARRIRMLGIGTERVEAEVRAAFPTARTLRWDRDVARGRDAHEAILSRFLAHEADVLIGTQMIAKGLDMPRVTLVGVVSADVALHFPDYRAGERTFQLLEQVAGRAGRGPRGGRVVIQTYTPGHYAVRAAGSHDYQALYDRELEFRRRLGYPPFGRLVRMVYAHTGADYARGQAAAMARRLKAERDRLGIANLHVLGPAPPFLPRLRGRWRWQIVLRGEDPAALLKDLPLARGWTVDVDPVSLL